MEECKVTVINCVYDKEGRLATETYKKENNKNNIEVEEQEICLKREEKIARLYGQSV